MSSLHDFQNEATSDGSKHKFGSLSVITNRVKTVTGAKYTIPGVMTRDTDGKSVLREFRGKQLTNDPNDRLHVIVVLEATDKAGAAYQDIRDDVSFADAIKIFKNSLTDVFGPNFADVFSTRGKVPVEIELVPTGEKTNTGKDKTTFKVLRQFSTDADRIVAEREYFRRFATNGTSTNGSGIPADVEQMARGLWDAVKNPDTFKNLAKGEPKLEPYIEQLAAKFATA